MNRVSPMPRAALIVCLVALAWAALASALIPAMAQPAAGRILIATDLHFDPMADPALVDRLSAADPGKWPAILDGAADKNLGHYGADTNWRLLRSTLRQMKVVLPDPAVVLLPGDFLAHGFRRAFDAAARRHSDADYRAFVDKTMQFLAGEIAREFPGRPILPALGNNDSDCGDYRLEPDGRFLAETLPILRRLLGAAAGEDVARDWTRYGNYGVVLPGLPGLRVIVVDTVFFSRLYRNRCGRPGQPDPGRATLAWLGHELQKAQQAGIKVWLVYHIPPGADAYAAVRAGHCPEAFVPLWKEAYAEPFDALMRRYAGTIAATFAGHLHMDDFRLIPTGDGSAAFVLITPAVSPIFGQNPAFRTVSFDKAGGLLDGTTYDLANLTTAGAGTPAAWQAEYAFTREWGLPRLDAASLARLARLIAERPAVRERWRQLYATSSPIYWRLLAMLGDRPARALRCAATHLSPQDFDRCYCGSAPRYLVPNRRSPASPSPGRM
jgi:sphingomyelin phosphodiesterase acid-like 3